MGLHRRILTFFFAYAVTVTCLILNDFAKQTVGTDEDGKVKISATT
jgi:hypothetical protein